VSSGVREIIQFLAQHGMVNSPTYCIEIKLETSLTVAPFVNQFTEYA
jgi:tRNA A37 threonylcarbamoyladenosine biosynthesis protein TsaE